MSKTAAKVGPTVLDFLFSLIGKLLVWLVKLLSKLIALVAVQAFLHPRTTATITLVSGLVIWAGWQTFVVGLVGVLVAASTWKAAHPRSFDRYAKTWARTWWRRWWSYRRTWDDVMTRCDLVVQTAMDVHVPKLMKVSTSEYWDELILKQQVGQELKQFLDAAEKLRGAYRSERIVVKEIKPAMVGIHLMRRDPLLEPVEPTPIPDTVADIDWTAIPVGRTEMCDPYCVSVLGGHTSIAGSTGGGKAGLQWNLLRGLGPAIAEGLVRPVGFDPKAKELRQALSLFAKGDYAVTAEETLALLERLCDELAEANERDGALGERDFMPRKGRPLTLILIDELAPLLKYWPRSIRGKIEDCLGLLLTQGRAAGFIVIGGIQEPTKDVFTIRDLFTRRISLRLPTESHTDAALIEDAVVYGAMCHQISEDVPGMLFSLENGARSTIRARLGWVQNDDIAELVAFVESRRNVVQLDAHRPVAAGSATKAA
jgi:S-DNA-T family DNA segregation ATPase FtsK/SpoIIIE